MKGFEWLGFRLSWLLALPLAGCLASGSAVAADDKDEQKKAEAAEFHKQQHTKDVQVIVNKDGEAGEGHIVLKVINEDGKRKIIRKRIKGGNRGFLGVHLVGLTPELKKLYTGDEKIGVLIGKLEPDSPALKAGILVGDVMVSVDGTPVDSALKIGELIGGHKKGDKVAIGVIRKGKKKELTATLAEHKRAFKKIIRVGEAGDFDLDIDLDHLGEEIGEAIEIEALEKLRDPMLKKKILMLKKQEMIEKKMEEKLKKMEERLKKLEEKLQGKLRKKLKGPAEKTT